MTRDRQISVDAPTAHAFTVCVCACGCGALHLALLDEHFEVFAGLVIARERVGIFAAEVARAAERSKAHGGRVL